MADTCKGCGHPIVPLQDARYTGREPEECWHYSCWSKDRPEPTNMRTLAAEMARSSLRVQKAFENLRSALRDPDLKPRKPGKQIVEYDDD